MFTSISIAIVVRVSTCVGLATARHERARLDRGDGVCPAPAKVDTVESDDREAQHERRQHPLQPHGGLSTAVLVVAVIASTAVTIGAATTFASSLVAVIGFALASLEDGEHDETRDDHDGEHEGLEDVPQARPAATTRPREDEAIGHVYFIVGPTNLTRHARARGCGLRVDLRRSIKRDLQIFQIAAEPRRLSVVIVARTRQDPLLEAPTVHPAQASRASTRRNQLLTRLDHSTHTARH